MSREARTASATATSDLLARLDASPRLDAKRYAIEEEVGSGGMGSVLRVHDRHLNRHLAMKVMLEGRTVSEVATDRTALQVLSRFLEEAQVTSQLDHPGVVPVHELGLDGSGKVFFTMRLVQGRTAAEVFDLAHGGAEDWTLPRALDVVLKVCDTVAYAHDKGVLHRDLKPTNVMVGRFGEVYVMDWGLAKVQGAQDHHAGQGESVQTARGADTALAADGTLASLGHHRVGTPCYMAPEQARGEELDARADVYAIGAMLYQLLVGHPPYLVPGALRTAQEVLDAVLSRSPVRVDAVRKDVPAELVAIVDKAMARDREARYGSVTDLAKDLRAFLDQRAVGAYRTGALVELKLWVRRNRPLAAALAAVVVTTAVGAVVSLDYAVEADTQRTQAQANEVLAEQRAQAEAEAKTRFAAKVQDFNQLSGVVKLREARLAEGQLYPAWPDKIEAMERWLAYEVQPLLDMRPQVDATLASLRESALPWTDAERQQDFEGHPEHGSWSQLAQKTEALRRAHKVSLEPARFELPGPVDGVGGKSAAEIRAMAWARVAPDTADRTVRGEELEGLALARMALEAVQAKQGEPSHAYLDTLAWAQVVNGLDAEALATSDATISTAPPARKERYARSRKAIERLISIRAEELAKMEKALAEFESRVRSRRTWTFSRDREAERFLHDTLQELRQNLDLLEIAEHREVRKRLGWARQLRDARITLAHPGARHTWGEVRASIAGNPRYAVQGIDLADERVLDLVPIGENPVTGLWEFYHLPSAWDGKQDPVQIPIPSHAPDGTIPVEEGTGIVFVLLPGGTYLMGAQAENPAAASHDPRAEAFETPHEVTLAPFFLARHELTQAQWSRLWAWDDSLKQPSTYRAGKKDVRGTLITGAHPVEGLDWQMCAALTRRSGLLLPTEAQWEYACRAGGSTPWQVDPARLGTVANLAGAEAKDAGAQWTCEDWSDGHVIHAPVGSYVPNAFGLFDMHGNVSEWTRDGFSEYGTERPGDGLRPDGDLRSPVVRGGGFNETSRSARSSSRQRGAQLLRANSIGLRLARPI